MDFSSILAEIKPTLQEQEEINKISKKLIEYINSVSKRDNIDCKAVLVGSVAKGTYLRGKSDIDIFISFPLSTSVDDLKEFGLDLGYRCSNYFNGKTSQHYASHPYVTSEIDGFEIDFVPCYKIDDGSQLKSAVDRTILHTKYIKANLKESQKDEVLLLKRFMDMTGTYGSEFKVGGFAGYLCELLILKYGTFENTLKNASKWKYGTVIDLEDYKTSDLFNDPLITIDPTDKNRNVGAALRLNKMAEFIQSARNYLNSEDKLSYFKKIEKNVTKEEIINKFNIRKSDVIVIKFNIPQIPLDTLHPQLRKTCDSLAEKLEKEEFNVYNADYWSDEKDIAILVLEMANSKLNSVKINYGPKIFIEKACKQFIDAHGIENCYVKDDFLVQEVKRQFCSAHDFISYLFNEDNISLIKVGKNLHDSILNTYSLVDLNSLEVENSFWNFLDDFIVPGQFIRR